jgi:hypothetical protein
VPRDVRPRNINLQHVEPYRDHDAAPRDGTSPSGRRFLPADGRSSLVSHGCQTVPLARPKQAAPSSPPDAKPTYGTFLFLDPHVGWTRGTTPRPAASGSISRKERGHAARARGPRASIPLPASALPQWPSCHWRVGPPRRQRWYHQSSGCFTSRFLSASVGFPIIIIPVRPPPAVFVAVLLASSAPLSLSGVAARGAAPPTQRSRLEIPQFLPFVGKWILPVSSLSPC